MKVGILRSGCAWLCLGIAAPAWAQSAPTAPADQAAPAANSGSADGLGEVIVTAQRRAENLQDVPVAAATLSSEGLAQKAVVRISDLQLATPSLSVSEGGLVQSVNIRGIGIASGSPSVANGVAIYTDGIFAPPIVSTGAFYDIANIEVLRGPQGTLVGSNSTGGAIFINSQNPTLDRIGGYVGGAYGNYQTAEVQGALNVPLTDTLAVRGAGQFRRHDSYYTDVGSFHNDAGRLNEKAGRIGLLWKPGNFQALIKSELVDHNTGGFAFRPIPGTPLAPYAVGDDFTLDYNAPTKQHEHGIINSAELRYKFDNGITLRSISGYTNKYSDLLIDNDATAAPAAVGGDVHTDQFVRERQLSQEINIISPTGGAFDWILGGYYQRNHINVLLHQLNAGFPLDVVQTQTKVTTGIFGQGNYKLTDALELQVGARYSHFRASGGGSVRIGAGIPGFPADGLQVADLTGANRDGRATGKVALNWKVNSDNLLYVFAARGYKPGGYNSAVSTFKPETVMNYELGWKANLADNHIRTQFDGFYNKYHGFQFGVLDTTSGQSGVTNLPTATIEGIEGQVQAKFGGFAADASLAYVKSKLPAFTAVNPVQLPSGTLGPQCGAGVPSNPPTCFDYGPYTGTAGGGPNLLSPKWTYSVGAQYSFDLGGGAKITPRLNYAYVGQQYTNLFYNPVTDRMDAHGVLSGLLTLDMGKWRIEAYGRNLTNKKYVLGQNGGNEFFGTPREYGLRANVNF